MCAPRDDNLNLVLPSRELLQPPPFLPATFVILFDTPLLRLVKQRPRKKMGLAQSPERLLSQSQRFLALGWETVANTHVLTRELALAGCT